MPDRLASRRRSVRRFRKCSDGRRTYQRIDSRAASVRELWRLVMTLALNDIAPDFEAETTEGRIRFHDWIGNNWAVLFSYPKDYTPVCTTELGYMARLKPEFDKRSVKIL